MTNPNPEQAPQAAKPHAKAAKFTIPEDFNLTVDRSRHVSEVHGEHADNLGFIQDGIPFDKAGRLIAHLCENPERKDHPFPRALEIIQRKIERRKREEEAAKQSASRDTSNPLGEGQIIDNDPDADVDLIGWAKGEHQYTTVVVYRVAKARLHKHFKSFPEIIAAMVEKKQITRDEVKVI